MQSSDGDMSYKQLFAFFIPLGVSASLTSITHVIINSTLSRGDNAAFIIACYAVAFALFGILERPIIVFRQTSSVLVKDLRTFKAVSRIFVYVISIILLISIVIGYTPIGDWLFIRFFNANEAMVKTISYSFNVIMFVFIFSGIRGIYQGVIISRLETKWLTIGVIVRLSFMFLVSYLFVFFDVVTSMAGAAIFLIGMFIECVISVWKGHQLLKESKGKKQPYLSNKTILHFYIPLVFYFVFQTIMIPVVYAFIAKTEEVEMSIASFALALSVANLLQSFFMYTHQLVVQFYKDHRQKLVRFMILLSLIPTLMLTVLCFSPLGNWFMEVVMGADDELAQATLTVLAYFILRTMLFPWVDFLNGFLMLARETKKMVISQANNFLIVFISLFFLTKYFPSLNGVNGAIAVSLGECAGLITVSIILQRKRNKDKSKKKSVASS
ncbi:multi antimicrobial extrusion protein MatE [Aquibacillus albus]|uniref:Na+-driven multidrug efflux pump n=1 Tax=Aquibacillus albus TaxID=1168171 RepID=A0ABS2MY77_9BACI|nr:multi antimicrobial extrusion protein MatE [Aquibacillus albus]MBM7570837.1 Na+-driven multidrug efflux pump [Aquibacillus albus]